jgi:plastocyanin
MTKLFRRVRPYLRLVGVIVAVVAAVAAPLAAPSHAQWWPGAWPGPGPVGPAWGTPWSGFGYGVPGMAYPGYGWPGAPAPGWLGPGGLGFPGWAPGLAPGIASAMAPARQAARAETQRRTVVSMQDFFFLPEEVTIPVGTTITWTNRGGTAHTATSTGIWDSGTVRPGQSWSATFATTGTFNYLCTIHPDRMTGRIVVEAETAVAPATTSMTTAPTGTTAGPMAAAGPVNPGTLLQRLTEAYNRGDASSALGLFVDDATFQGAGTCMTAACRGREAIQRELVRAFAQHVTVTPGPAQVTGNTVTAQFQVTDDAIRSMGVQRIIGTVSLEARGDRIGSFRITPDSSDPQTATAIQRMMAAMASSGTAVPAPTPPSPVVGSGATAMRAVLSPQAGSGVSGEATLAQTGDATTVTVTLSGLAPDSAHAGHIHGGSCSGPILFPLATIRADSMGQGSGTATVNAPIDAANWWVQYHASDSPPGTPIACGQPGM